MVHLFLFVIFAKLHYFKHVKINEFPVNKTNSDKPKFDFAVGGQALIEGVMMRSAHFVALAVRKQDGSIKVHDWPFISICRRYKFLNIPIVRGVINMVETMIIGFKAMNISAEEAVETQEEILEKHKPEVLVESHKTSIWTEIVSMVMFALNLIIALALGLALFKFAPLYITEFLRAVSPTIAGSDFLYNLIDGGLKITIFITYILLIGLIPSIGRVFSYHAAEHQAVFAYEHAPEVNIETARRQTRFHPRCGTSFIFLVLIVSILIYTLVPRNENFLLQFLQRLAVLPLIAGVGYEVLKTSAKYQNSPFVRWITVPGLWLQRLTTRESDDSQLEVAATALNRTLELETNFTMSATKNESTS